MIMQFLLNRFNQKQIPVSSSLIQITRLQYDPKIWCYGKAKPDFLVSNQHSTKVSWEEICSTEFMFEAEHLHVRTMQICKSKWPT